MKVRDILQGRNKAVVTIEPGDTAQDAVRKLVEHNIGALPVTDRGKLVGILSERDLLRSCGIADTGSKDIKIKDVMTRDVCVCVPGDDIDYVMNMMRQRGIRHLPVMDGPELGGIISVRDVFEARLEACQVEVRHLSDYIAGGYS